MPAEKDSIDWHALAQAERLQYLRLRAVQWKLHLGLWALIAAGLYTVYVTEVVDPAPCVLCWILEGCMGLHFLWSIVYQRELESGLARWSYYQGYADDSFTEEHIPSLLHPRALLGILVPSGVTSGLLWCLIVLLRNPPYHA